MGKLTGLETFLLVFLSLMLNGTVAAVANDRETVQESASEVQQSNLPNEVSTTATHGQIKTLQANVAGKSWATVALSADQQIQFDRAVASLGRRLSPVPDLTIFSEPRIPNGILVQPLPVVLARIIPQWEGYSFLRLSERLLIVDPHSLSIVAGIPVSATATRVPPETAGNRKGQKSRAVTLRKTTGTINGDQVILIDRTSVLTRQKTLDSRKQPEKMLTGRPWFGGAN